MLNENIFPWEHLSNTCDICGEEMEEGDSAECSCGHSFHLGDCGVLIDSESVCDFCMN